MRGFLAGLLILIGGGLTFPAALVAWEQRVLLDEDRFVATGNKVLERDEVQDALAQHFAGQVESETGVPPAASGPIARQAVRGLANSPASSIALHGAFEFVEQLLRGESIDTEDTRIVVDFRPVAEEIRSSIGVGGGTPVASEVGLVTVVEQNELTQAFKLARWVDRNAIWIALAPVVAFGVALLIASNRFIAIAAIGVMVVVTSGLRILIVKSALASALVDAVVSDATYQAAADAAYDEIAGTFVGQDIVVLVIGMAMVFFGIAGAALWPRYS